VAPDFHLLSYEVHALSDKTREWLVQQCDFIPQEFLGIPMGAA
jgi:hypothetical protein